MNKEIIKQYLRDRNLWNCLNDNQFHSAVKVNDTIKLEIYLFPTSSFLTYKEVEYSDFIKWLRNKKLENILNK